MAIDRSVKVGIGTSIIATALFIYFLDPILSLCGRSAVLVFSQLSSSLVDHLFEKVALCSAPDPAFSIWVLAMGMISGISFGFAIGLITSAVRRKKGSPPSIPLHFRLSLHKKVVIAVVFTLIVHAMAILSLWSGWFQLKTVSSFQQHMKAVAPYLTEEREELIWSQWTQMQSRRDYDLIYSELQKVADENSVRLPENKVYSATSL